MCKIYPLNHFQTEVDVSYSQMGQYVVTKDRHDAVRSAGTRPTQHHVRRVRVFASNTPNYGPPRKLMVSCR
ncbi:hypothetical protein SCLCIDRAFT_1206574 [Scleroderma citrinum Foug A]|uniref:Uncharacterized protein n=1 Tax=Scleroderma citrinum Foug A TaxID=1036808 RepID=A0A0C3ERI3_9AGAM|nr:hypothetical protein SCLCIDRAFT_1206574 [Scleroderma citrinum Foug A]